jgi:hypothetical protein
MLAAPWSDEPERRAKDRLVLPSHCCVLRLKIRGIRLRARAPARRESTPIHTDGRALRTMLERRMTAQGLMENGGGGGVGGVSLCNRAARHKRHCAPYARSCALAVIAWLRALRIRRCAPRVTAQARVTARAGKGELHTIERWRWNNCHHCSHDGRVQMIPCFNIQEWPAKQHNQFA